jgi:cation transport regulator ChaC
VQLPPGHSQEGVATLRLSDSVRRHPLLHVSMRWRIAGAKAWQLVAFFILVELALAAALSALFAATYRSGQVAGPAEERPALVRTWLVAIRAVLGMDGFPRQPGNPYHEVLATFAAIVGALTPAVILSVLVVRIFSVRPFVWRSRMNVCTMIELRSDVPRAVGGDEDGIIAIRWYKHLNGLTINDLSAEVYYAFYETSAIDGSVFFRRERLCVLDADGHEADRRVWPQIMNPMPLTLWIPLRAPLAEGRIAEIQGRKVFYDVATIFVKVQGKIGGLGIELQDEHQYVLSHDAQRGRAVSVQVDASVPARRWRGWARFDEAATYGIFAYGKLVSTAEFAGLTGAAAVENKDCARAALRGWKRSWSVGMDNTGAAEVHYVDPATGDPPPGQILFLNLEPDGAARTEGIVFRIPPSQLIHIDRREQDYVRVQVTDMLDLAPGFDCPDVVWAYVGKDEYVRLARQAIIRGTALILRQYLDAACDALGSYDGLLLQTFAETELPARVPVVALTRVAAGPGGQ